MDIANLSTHLEKDIRVVSSLRVFQINLLWTRMYKSVYEHIFSFVLDKSLGVQWLDSVVGLCLNLKKNIKIIKSGGDIVSISRVEHCPLFHIVVRTSHT